MKRIGLLIGFLAVILILLPSSPAQDAKKDVDKTDKKKDETKKDLDKKSDAKDPEKKEEKKEPEKKKAPEKLVYGAKLVTRIQGFKGESREYTIEVQELDPNKVFALKKWTAERSVQLAQQQFNAASQTDMNTRIQQLQQYQQDVFNFKKEVAQRSSQLTTAKRMEIRAAENAKVRVMTPPLEFDDAGFPKKWTKKELTELREKNPLHLSQGDSRAVLAPGFPAEFDAIKQGQVVEVYMTKVTPMAKKKKGPDDDDPPAMKGNEFVLMVVVQEGK